MLAINQLDLEYLPIATKAFGDDPYPYIDKARARHDWLAGSDIGYVITGYQAIDDIMRQDDKLTMPGEEIVDLMGARGTGWGDFALEQMLVDSGERHARLRGAVSAAFLPGNVKQLRPIMRETVRAICDEWVPKGAFDFTEFAAQFPVRVMFKLLGTSTEKLPSIMKMLEIHGESFNLEVEKMGIIEEGYQTLWRFVDDIVVARGREAGEGDLLDSLIAATSRGEINEKELRQLLILLFAAGYDTTKNLIILLMRSLLDHPEIYRRCGEDFEYCKKVVKEQLRFATPSNTMRLVTQGFAYRDVEIPAGTMLIFPLTISSRDPAVFGNPGKFDPDRPERKPSQAFGRGMHICLGQFLATANVEEGLHEIARRITNPRLVGDVHWKPFPGVWGITQLPIAFDPA